MMDLRILPICGYCGAPLFQHVSFKKLAKNYSKFMQKLTNSCYFLTQENEEEQGEEDEEEVIKEREKEKEEREVDTAKFRYEIRQSRRLKRCKKFWRGKKTNKREEEGEEEDEEEEARYYAHDVEVIIFH